MYLCSLIVTSVETSSDIINQTTVTGNSKQLIASSSTSGELLL